METVNPEYLITDLRLRLGDTNPATYRYTDEWLKIALLASIRALGAWWKNKYLVDSDTQLVSRNSSITFEFSEPPVIEQDDEFPIIIMATIIIMEGSLENASWNLVSWRDNEISFTNLEQGRIKTSSLSRLWDLLLSELTPPTKKLAGTSKQSLQGYKLNINENRD